MIRLEIISSLMARPSKPLCTFLSFHLDPRQQNRITEEAPHQQQIKPDRYIATAEPRDQRLSLELASQVAAVLHLTLLEITEAQLQLLLPSPPVTQNFKSIPFAAET